MLLQNGGRIYGKGSKGHLIDITCTATDDNECFISSQSSPLSSESINLINDKGKVSISVLDFMKLTDGKFLIKVFNNIENYISEMKISTQLINSSIIDDYIEYNGEKYYGVQNNLNSSPREYGILKIKCTMTVDNFKIISSSVKPSENAYQLIDFCREILSQIINLQNNNYVHCDIKADNIMMCPILRDQRDDKKDQRDDKKESIFKLIDWDLAVNTTEYSKSIICKNRYIGSATHTSPILESTTKELCGTKTIGQSLKRIVSTSLLERRNITREHNLVNDITKAYLLSLKDPALISLYKYHVDLYSFSITLFELANTDAISKGIEKFCTVLQNTVFVSSDPIKFMYVTHNRDDHLELDFEDLLALIPSNFYLF